MSSILTPLRIFMFIINCAYVMEKGNNTFSIILNCIESYRFYIQSLYFCMFVFSITKQGLSIVYRISVANLGCSKPLRWSALAIKKSFITIGFRNVNHFLIIYALLQKFCYSSISASGFLFLNLS